MQKQFLLTCILLCTAVLSYGQYDPRSTRQPSEWSGTGWALNKGYVVTNHHLANNARTIVLKFMQGETLVDYSGETVLMEEEHDLAIIKVNDSKFKGFGTLPYAVNTSLADVG
jgi:S1-C subfamily serine protease